MAIDWQHEGHQRLWAEQFQWHDVDEKVIRMDLRETRQRKNCRWLEIC